MPTVTFTIAPDIAFDSTIDVVVNGKKTTAETETTLLTRCIVAFFQNAQEITSLRRTITSEDGYEHGTTVTVNLSSGQTYTVVAYLDNNKSYIDVADLKEITLAKDGYQADGQPRIFTAKTDITVSSSMSITIVLKRRYNAVSLVDSSPSKYVATKLFSMNSFVPNVFNALAERILDAVTGVYFSNVDRVNFLAMPTSSSLAMQIRFKDGAGNVIKLTDPIHIPILQNQQTNVFYASSIKINSFVYHSEQVGTIDKKQIRFVRHDNAIYEMVYGLPQLATPQNVTADGTTVSWDAVENATSYAVLADGNEIGTVEGTVTEDPLAGTWVFNDTLGNTSLTRTYVNFTSNNTNYTSIELQISSGPFIPGFEMKYYNEDIKTIVCSSDFGWANEAYKTITITSKLSEVSNGDTLLAWLQANATKQ